MKTAFAIAMAFALLVPAIAEAGTSYTRRHRGRMRNLEHAGTSLAV